MLKSALLGEDVLTMSTGSSAGHILTHARERVCCSKTEGLCRKDQRVRPISGEIILQVYSLIKKFRQDQHLDFGT
jgi:hypothetical protein